MYSERIYKFDNIKFLLIILVVYCHLINVGFLVPWSLYKIIYSFHMPLFIIISGYFTNKEQNRIKFWDSTLLLVFLFIIFNVVSIIVYAYFCKVPPVDKPFIPSFALWYLLCMIYWRIILRILPYKLLRNIIFIVSCFIVSILPAVRDFNYFAISRAMSFFPFFLLGWNLRQNNLISKINNLSTWTKIGIISLSIGCCLCAINLPSEILWGNTPPLMQGIDIQQIVIYKSMSWIIALVISASIYIIIPNQQITNEGRYTLFYYLLHILFLYPILDLISEYLPQGHLITLLTLVWIISSIFFLRRIRFIQKFFSYSPLGRLTKYNQNLYTNGR